MIITGDGARLAEKPVLTAIPGFSASGAALAWEAVELAERVGAPDRIPLAQMRAGAHYRSVSRGEWQRGVAGIAEQIPLCLGPHTRLDLRMAYFSLLARFAPEKAAAEVRAQIAATAEDAEVAAGFVVYAIAEDPRGLSHIKLYLNGAKWLDLVIDDVDPGPHALRTAEDLPDGYLDIEVRAYNDLELPGSAFVTVLKGAPCTSAATCLDGQGCDDGRCSWPPPSVEFGQPCVRSPDCLSELCAEREELSLCTLPCDEDEDCEGDFTCYDDGVCWLPGDGGGCCSVGDGRRPWLAHGLLAALVLVLVILGPRRSTGHRGA